MSGSDGEDGQCKRTRESNVVDMGDILAKKHTDDTPHGSPTSSPSDLTRQNADGAAEYDDDDVRSPALADSVPLASMTHDESAINAFIKGAKDSENSEQPCPRLNPETSPENSSSSTTVTNSPSRHGKETCSCDTYKAKRELFREELQKAMKFQNLWTELKQNICSAFNAALESTRTPGIPKPQLTETTVAKMNEIVLQLRKRDPRQLFMRLVSQVQEFVVEVKVPLLGLLHDRSINNLAEIFLTALLDDYDALALTASQISELVKPLRQHLYKFNLTWECFIKKLYQIYVYNDPLVQNNLPPFIGQLRKLLPIKGSEYQRLVHRYLSFDDEMMRIGDLWPETEPWMDKYNAEQTVRMTRLRQIREAWELFTATRKLMEHRMSHKSHETGKYVNVTNEYIDSDSEEIGGELSTAASPEKVGISGTDSRPLSPTPDCSLDSLNMPPSIEIVQFLLDDWNKAQHPKLADIAGALTATEIYANGQDEPDFFDYARVTCHLAQFAIRSVRDHNDGTCSETSIDETKNCESYLCIPPSISSIVSQSANEDVISPQENTFTTINNGFSEDAEKISKMQSMIDATDEHVNEAKSDDTTTRSSTEDTDLRTSKPQLCLCVYQHAKDLAEKKRDVLENPPCPCLLKSKRKRDSCPCLKKSVPETSASNNHSKPVSLTSPTTKTNQESSKPAAKSGSSQSAQTRTRHSTTQTRNSTAHNHTTHQVSLYNRLSYNAAIEIRDSTLNAMGVTGTTHPHTHGPLPDLVKSTGSTHRPHAHNNHTSHACHKQANVEHIKRVSCNGLSSGDGDCSDSGSSQGDSCSTSSSAQRESSRHCDCCYCEVFGHGVPSVAPVSRNYNEIRERLRQLLTKKKAKKCKATCKETKTVSNSAARSNTPVSTTSIVQSDQRGQWDLDELLDFIEGNQNGKKDNNKKAEKKARQKQRKLEEKLKRDRQEEEKQKLIELQKKTPEVTITVVDPQKPVPQRLLPQCNLPEVSILPTSPPVALQSVKQLNNKRKDKQEVCSNSSNGSSSSCSISSSNSSLNSKTKTAPVNTNLKNKSINTSKVERAVSSSQANKPGAKTDKIELSNKSNKTPTNNNGTNVKINASNTADKPSTNADETDKKLTKKERKKLKKEMKKMEETQVKELEKTVQTESPPQIVTIKRVMESNSAEPTVTITLKGQTPAEDKVLFTLVNGQTKEFNPQKLENEQSQSINGKKKKAKACNNNNNNTNNNNNNNSPVQQGNKSQQGNNSKQQSAQSKICDGKNLKQQVNNDKSKGKQADERKTQQQSTGETKAKSKKEKKSTENVLQQNTVNKSKSQQQNVSGKKQNKISSPPQTPVTSKPSQNSSNANEVGKKIKGQQDKNSQLNSTGSNKSIKTTSSNAPSKLTKPDNQKVQSKITNQATTKVRTPSEVQPAAIERVSSPLSNQFKDIGANSKINIENLKLPPGITITKVDAPAKPLPIRSAPMPKPVNPPKQTTIIAAPMSGVQSSYASPQAGGNVIVVDTGKLKQDLLPKAAEKDVAKETQQSQSTTGKKKKKKSKNGTNTGNTGSPASAQCNDPFANDHTDEPARILHNPGTNMVTIRNPAFGPMKVPPTQQAAIIKVSENGMVTIRSPALQQAINAGLTSPPKPDYIVKGDLSSKTSTETLNASIKPTNGIIPSSLAELRSRLTPDCTSLSGLANIQISKVANGQPIPENGINLKGTSVTLTKVRTETSMEDMQSAKTAVREAINASLAASSTGKSKKKKKRGTGTRQCGDDWNLVESVFTPKDIDLEDGEMDDAERELEAFKRFCLQSVPPPRKEKVNLNIKDIVLKKKSSSSSSSAATAVIAAN